MITLTLALLLAASPTTVPIPGGNGGVVGTAEGRLTLFEDSP